VKVYIHPEQGVRATEASVSAVSPRELVLIKEERTGFISDG